MFNGDVCEFLEKRGEYEGFMRKFEDNNVGLIYAAEYSDPNISSECRRCFIEFRIEEIILPEKEGDDPKYLIRCAVKLRNYKGADDVSMWRAYASVVSPHLLSWAEFGNIRNINGDRRVLNERMQLIGSVLREDESVDKIYRNWQKEHLSIVKERQMDVGELLQNVLTDLSDVKTKVKLFEKI